MPKKYHCEIKNSKNWIYKEEITLKDTFYIVGAGHVGFACSKLFSTLGFHVVIFDNRENLNTFEINNFAHQKQIIHYQDLANYIKEGDDVYVAIMTTKYSDDKVALSQIIRNKYKFLGVLGSKAKLQTMNNALEQEGFTKKELAKIHAPIGLAIGSQTPDEIAISIAAQIIQLKNKIAN